MWKVRKNNCSAMIDGALYTEGNCLQRHDAENFWEEFVDELGEMSGRCIDIGSGPGDVVADVILPRLNSEATIVGSDISENMVNFGNEKYRNNERMSFIQLDIETRNLPSDLVAAFDHVTSFYCIHWCQDIRQVFENIFNLLRPGGTSFVAFVAQTPWLNAYTILSAMPRYAPYMKDADRYIPVFQHAEQPREVLKKLLRGVGFRVQHCSVREKSWTFDTSEDFRKFVVPLNPFMDRIPAHIRAEYKKDLVREAAGQNIIFNKNHKNDDFGVIFRYNVFVLHLGKPLAKSRRYLETNHSFVNYTLQKNFNARSARL